MPVYATLRKAREKAGISLEKAAEAIGISGASFSRMENGISKVTTDRLEELAKLYGVSASALLEGDIVTNPSNVDIDRMREVVEVVQSEVNRLKKRPSPEKMGLAVSEVYRIEIERIVENAKAEFSPERHKCLIEAIFSK